MSVTTQLHQYESGAGASFGSFAGGEEVIHFGDARAEYDALRYGAGILDMSSAGKLQVTGRDRQRYLNNMLTNDIKNLAAGSGCHAALLTRQGLMETDLWVYAGTDELWIECPACATGQVLASLRKHIVSEIVNIEDRSGSVGIFSIQGPKAREAAERRLKIDLSALRPLDHRALEGNGVFVARRDRTGFDGWDLWIPGGDAADSWQGWVKAGGVLPVGFEALNWARTEAGIPWYGVDMNDKNLPMEMGLDAAISMTKGCYRGQEIVARITHRGRLDRRLAAVVVDHDRPPMPDAEVLAQEAKIGHVTSAVISPQLRKPLALAVVKSAYLQAGTAVDVSYQDGIHPGRIVTVPLPR